MYNAEKNTYICDFCGYDECSMDYDRIHGLIWMCENPGCHNYFCVKCFSDKFGDSSFDDMLENSPMILCPDCYKKLRSENNDSI